jgi:hypothetical protein
LRENKTFLLLRNGQNSSLTVRLFETRHTMPCGEKPQGTDAKPFTACGECRILKGHDFSRAANASK